MRAPHTWKPGEDSETLLHDDPRMQATFTGNIMNYRGEIIDPAVFL